MRKNANYTILKATQIGETEIVLGFCPTAAAQYVTWRCDNGNNYYWGHYCQTYETALQDYRERIAELIPFA